MVSCKLSACDAGTHATAGSANTEAKATCLRCPAGTYSGSTGLADASECELCPEGRWNGRDGSTAFSDCKLCPAGTYGNDTARTNNTCTGLCPPGTHSKEGVRECAICGKGQYQPKQGGSVCADCPIKETTLEKGGTACVCEKKYYRDKGGKCTVCNPEDMDCEKDGITIETMEIVGGAWRANNGSDNIYVCPVKEACESPHTIVGSLLFPTIATPDDFTPTMQAGLKATYATKCGVTADKITLVISPAARRRQRHQRRRLFSSIGVNVTYTVQVDSKTAAEKGKTALDAIATGGDTAMLSFIAELKKNTPGGGFASVDTITIAAPVVEKSSSLCARGQTGVLCASCEPGWFRRGSSNMCQACPKDTSEATGWTVGILLTLLMAFFTFLGLDLKFGWTRSKGGSRFKPAVNAVQAMTVIYLFPVKWPPMMVKLSKVFEGFSVDVAVLSPSCFGIAFGFYQRFLWSSLFAFTCVLGPFLVSAVVSLIRALFPQCCGCWKEERAENGWETTRTFQARYRLAWHVALPVVTIYSMVVVLFVHPTISGQAFFFFRCHEIKDIEPTLLGGGNSTTNAAQTTVGYTATSYLVADYSLKCYDGGWNTMLPYALLVVIGFSLGMPLFLMWQLCKHRKVIQEIGRQAMLEDAAKNEEEARNEKPSIGRRAATSIGGGLKALARKANTRVRSLSRSRASPGGARGFDVAPSHTSGEVKIDDGGDGADGADAGASLHR